MTSKKKDLYNLADGWLELESDPGLFTLLLEDMGVEGTQVGWHNMVPSSHKSMTEFELLWLIFLRFGISLLISLVGEIRGYFYTPNFLQSTIFVF